MKKRGIGCLMALVMLCGLLTGCGGSKEKENMKIYYINALGDGIGAVRLSYGCDKDGCYDR